MKDKINIIQFMPYFPPHKWGLETVWEEIWKYWVKNNLWKFINVITDFEQNSYLSKSHVLRVDGIEQIIFEWEVIWYKKDWYEVLICPSIEIIRNFPVYKIWSKKYFLMKRYLKFKIWSNNKNYRVFTHTRFFLTSLIWWIFSRKNKTKWIHIEHWSDYVKLSSKLKTILSIIYDKTFWKWIFKKTDKILAISNACKNFINKKFTNKNVDVFYRGIELLNNIKINENLNNKFKWKVIIWYIGRLYKWKNVESLIKAYYLLKNNDIQLIIVWDWEDFERLKKIDPEDKVYFTWWQSFESALSYQKQFDIHIHSSSPWWWLATTLLQAMSFWCMIVATPNEWAKEVIINNKNWFLLKNDSIEEIKRWIILAIDNLDKREKFDTENKKNIKKKFSWEENIFKLYKLTK
jgi:glycosyltransferase involved in cell wall biosynthesis